MAFFETALQALDPQSYGNYEQGKRALSAKLDLDIDKDVIDQLTGNLSVSATIQGKFGARAEVKDPAAFERTVDKVAKALPQFGLGDKVTKRGDLYTLAVRRRRHDVRVRGRRRRLRGRLGRGARPRAWPPPSPSLSRGRAARW